SHEAPHLPVRTITVSGADNFLIIGSGEHGKTNIQYLAIDAGLIGPATGPVVKKGPVVAPAGNQPDIKEVWKVSAKGELPKFMPDGAKLASFDKGTIHLYDVKDGKPLGESKVAETTYATYFPCRDDQFLVLQRLPEFKTNLICWDTRA